MGVPTLAVRNKSCEDETRSFETQSTTSRTSSQTPSQVEPDSLGPVRVPGEEENRLGAWGLLPKDSSTKAPTTTASDRPLDSKSQMVPTSTTTPQLRCSEFLQAIIQKQHEMEQFQGSDCEINPATATKLAMMKTELDLLSVSIGGILGEEDMAGLAGFPTGQRRIEPEDHHHMDAKKDLPALAYTLAGPPVGQPTQFWPVDSAGRVIATPPGVGMDCTGGLSKLLSDGGGHAKCARGSFWTCSFPGLFATTIVCMECDLFS